MTYTPIAIFAYNRKKSLENLLASLKECPQFRESPIFIFVDGPKQKTDRKVLEVQEYVHSLIGNNIKAVISENNKGLKNSIYQGVSFICEQHGRCIVLEDDLTVSPNALAYFNDALDRYETNHNISSVCGYMFKTKQLQTYEKNLFLPFSHPWGWATWHRAWRDFNPERPICLAQLQATSFHKTFNANGLNNLALLKLELKNQVNSWYIHWLYWGIINGTFAVFPPRRYVDNYGFNGNGTHASALNPRDLLFRRPPIEQNCIELSADAHIDFWALDAISQCWEVKVQRNIAFLGKLKRQFRALFS